VIEPKKGKASQAASRKPFFAGIQCFWDKKALGRRVPKWEGGKWTPGGGGKGVGNDPPRGGGTSVWGEGRFWYERRNAFNGKEAFPR